ncbi:Gfo/Idh/MocA family oxidoreductase [Hungatella hathewayi]|uniref:Gfo/Idh/MocA family protein n=1 Tax=Hungatella hathewayi TaxID=154046 RepID=UPI00034007A6|nr:Gfo/Idh/MocA family oxidoreductase [Hungatella hathewayi]CCZ62879.1 putative MviM protein [Hungatella hathewayi CAG:224]
MKTGIWGAGNIAHTHAEALLASGITVGAIVDVDSQKAEAFAKEFGIEKWGTDPSILLEDEITTVHVCTPPNLHYEMVMMLLDHKKNVLCEKPLCFDNKQAEELANCAKECGVVCAINFNVRFHMACQKARKLVEAGEFGRVNLIHGSYLQEFNAFPAPIDWRYNTVLAGRMRAVTEIGTHWLDIAEYISGCKVVALSASFGRFYPERYVENRTMYPDSGDGRRTETIEVLSEDAAAVSLKFDNGAIGTVLLSEVSQGRINRITLEVTGEKKNLWWNSEDNNILNTAVKGGGVNSEIFGFGNGFTDTFRSLVNSFYEDVKKGKVSEQPVYPTFEEGKNIVEYCNAMLESADQDGRWVSIR